MKRKKRRRNLRKGWRTGVILLGTLLLLSVFSGQLLAAPSEEPAEQAEQTEDAPPDLSQCAEQLLQERDFSSCRLLVCCSGRDDAPQDDPHLLSVWKQIYLLQYDTPEETAEAYAFWQEHAAFVEADTGITVADQTLQETERGKEVLPAAEEGSAGSAAGMTGEENPFALLEEAPAVGTYDIALIDTGADAADAAVSVIGENLQDENGHGSRMLAYMKEENPAASILSIKALGADGTGDVSAVYAALQYAILQQVKIINLSLSAPAFPDSQVIEEAVKEAAEKGILVVGAAGNNGKDAGFYVPGRIPQAWIIGACQETGEPLPFSNYGETVDYYVTAESTSQAAARFSAWLSANSLESIGLVLNQGFVFAPGGRRSTTETEPETQEEAPDLEPEQETGTEALRERKETVLEDEEMEIKAPMEHLENDVQAETGTRFSAAETLTVTGSDYHYNVVEYGTSKVFEWEQYAIGGTRSYCTEWGCDPRAGNYYTKGRTYTTAKAVNVARVKYLMDTAGSSAYGLNAREREWIVQRYIWETNLLGLNWTAANGHGWTLRGSSHAKANDQYSSIVRSAEALSYVSGSVTHYTVRGDYQDMVTVSWQAYGNVALKKGRDSGTESLAHAVYSVYAADKTTVVGWFITNTDGTGQVAVRIAPGDVKSFQDVTADYTTVTNRGKAAKTILVKKGKTIRRSDTGGSGTLVNVTLTADTTYSFGRLNPQGTYWYLKTSATSMRLPVGTYYYKEGFEPMNQLYHLDDELKGPFSVSAGTGVTQTFDPKDERIKGSLRIDKVIETGTLKIAKTVKGEKADHTRPFSFLLKLTDASGHSLSGAYSYTGGGGKSNGKLTLRNGQAAFTLSDGQEITLTGLPAGTKYTVTETAEEDYTVTKNPQSGQIKANQEFTFTINLKNGTANVKNLSLPYSGSKKGTLKTDSSGNAVIKLKGGESVTFSGIPIGYHYTVKESEVSGFSARSSGESGTIKKTTAKATFTNTPSLKSLRFQNLKVTPKTGGFRLTKTVDAEEQTLYVRKFVENGGAEAEAQEFTFAFETETEGTIRYSRYDENDQLISGFQDRVLTDNGSGTFLLRHGEYVKIGLPSGSTYRIREEPIPAGTTDETLYHTSLSCTEGKPSTSDGRQEDRQETDTFHGSSANAQTRTSFHFTVTLKDANGNPAEHLHIPYSGTVQGKETESAIQTGSNGQFTMNLTDGDSVLFLDIPEGYRYSVKETETKGFVQEAINAQETAIIASKTAETTFINHTTPQPQTVTFYNTPAFVPVQLAVRKTDRTTGKLLSGVSFLLTDLEDPSETCLYQTAGEEPLPVIRSFLKPGHTYTLKEQQTPAGYVLNDDVVTFYADASGGLHFTEYTDASGKHPVAAVRHLLESGNEEKEPDVKIYTVKEKGTETAPYEISYSIQTIDEDGKASASGTPCYILHISDEPNCLKLEKQGDDGQPLAGTAFAVRAVSLPEDDNTTIIAYRDAEYTLPFCNGDRLTTDEKGQAWLYRLHPGQTDNGEDLPERTEEIYLFTETGTVAGKQLLLSPVAVCVTEKGRIRGTVQTDSGRTLLSFQGAETRADGNVQYLLHVTDAQTLTLMTGGDGAGRVYLTGMVLAAVTGLLILGQRRRNRKIQNR